MGVDRLMVARVLMVCNNVKCDLNRWMNVERKNYLAPKPFGAFFLRKSKSSKLQAKATLAHFADFTNYNNTINERWE